MSRHSRTPGTPQRPSVLYVLPSISDDLDAATKNMIAARNACATEGSCPICACTPTLHADTDLDGVWHLVFEHEHWCGVGDGRNAA